MSTACFIDNAKYKQKISLHKRILEIEFTINFLSLNSDALTNVRKFPLFHMSLNQADGADSLAS